MSTLIKCPVSSTSLSNIFDELSKTVFYCDKSDSHSIFNVDIAEFDDLYLLKADLPGLDKKDISITIDKNVLSIGGEYKSEQKKADSDFLYHERNTGKFSRSFSLHSDIDINKIEAKMNNGVLELTLHKVIKKQPDKIDIKIQ